MIGVAGCCPMGCGETLFLGEGEYITCSFVKCPRPSAASEILQDPQIEHIVEFKDHHYTVAHPLRERLDNALMDCKLDDYVFNLDGPPVRPGRYEVRPLADGRRWGFTEIDKGKGEQ